jgi:hypothetical protein
MKPENVETVDDDIDRWKESIDQWKKGEWNNQYENREPISLLDCKKKRD